MGGLKKANYQGPNADILGVALLNPATGAAAGESNPGQAAMAASSPVAIASDQTAVPVKANPGSLTNRSGTITSGGTAQNAAAALSTRVYFFLLNPATETEILWFSTVATAVAASPSIPLYPGQSFEFNGTFCPSGAVSVIAATTGHVWIGREG